MCRKVDEVSEEEVWKVSYLVALGSLVSLLWTFLHMTSLTCLLQQ